MDVMGDEPEEAFDLVQAGSIGWWELNVPALTSGEPVPDLGCLWWRGCQRRDGCGPAN